MSIMPGQAGDRETWTLQVLVIDEAHLMDPAQLEELRLLTSAEMDSASAFAGILVGQPTLSRQLRMGTFAAYVARKTMSRCRSNEPVDVRKQ